MPTVLITPEPLRNQPGTFREVFAEAGFRCIDFQGEAVPREASLCALLPEVDAIVAGSESISSSVLDSAPRLRVIARTGVGYDAVDIAAASRRKVPVVVTPGTNQESVAEQTFALLLALTRRIVKNDQIIHGGGWDRTLVQPIRGKTMGLLGLGRIGRAVASRANAFGMRVVAFDPISGDNAFDAQYGIERLDLDAVLSRSDVVSLHLPLLPATRGLVDTRFLAQMREGSYLINTARGGLVVEADLAASLVSGHLAGAGLDVLCVEPADPSNPLLTAPNVVLSPHMGGIDTKSMADMAELAARCIVRLYQGSWPEGCVVNQELAQGWCW